MLKSMLTVMSPAFRRSWAGITTVVLCTMRLRTGTGGALRRTLVRYGTAWITMVVAYIPATTAATMGAMCGVSQHLEAMFYIRCVQAP